MVGVVGGGVEPGVAVEAEDALAGIVMESDGFEEELGGVVVGDDDGAGETDGLLVLERHVKRRLAGRQRSQRRDPVLQVRLLTDLPFQRVL